MEFPPTGWEERLWCLYVLVRSHSLRVLFRCLPRRVSVFLFLCFISLFYHTQIFAQTLLSALSDRVANQERVRTTASVRFVHASLVLEVGERAEDVGEDSFSAHSCSGPPTKSSSQCATCARCEQRVLNSLPRPHRHVHTARAPVVPSMGVACTYARHPIIGHQNVSASNQPHTSDAQKKYPRPRYKRVATTKKGRAESSLLGDGRQAIVGRLGLRLLRRKEGVVANLWSVVRGAAGRTGRITARERHGTQSVHVHQTGRAKHTVR